MQQLKKYTQPIHSNNKRIKKLRAGQTVYTVHSLGENSYLSKHTVISRPTSKVTFTKYSEDGQIFEETYDSVLLKTSSEYGTFTSENSLKDMNVIPNNYNDHIMTHSRRKAEAYLKLCLQGTIQYYRKDWDWGEF